MKRIIVLVAIASLLFVGGCTQPDKAASILQREGYSDIRLEGYAILGCSEDDIFRTKFAAIKNGQAVQGVVCSGFLKGSTVRTFD